MLPASTWNVPGEHHPSEAGDNILRLREVQDCDGMKRTNFLTLHKTSYEKFKGGAKGGDREESKCLME